MLDSMVPDVLAIDTRLVALLPGLVTAGREA